MTQLNMNALLSVSKGSHEQAKVNCIKLSSRL